MVLPVTKPEAGVSAFTDTSSSDTGVGGSTLSIVSNAVAGQPAIFSFNQIPGPAAPVAVNQVGIVPSKNIAEVQMIALPVTLGNALPGQTVAGYFRITPVGINPDFLGSGRIRFSVYDPWMRDHKVNPREIVLMRNHDNRWTELPTTFDHVAGNINYFDAATPGFSYFAIVAQAPRLVPNATEVPSGNSVVQTTRPFSTTLHTTQPSGQYLVTTQKVENTTTLIPAVSSSSNASPINWVVMGSVCFIILIGIVFLVRRWWIRRENPALFREYD